MHPRPTLLGVPFDPLASCEEACKHIVDLLAAPGQHHVMTPNAEMLVEGTRNKEFLTIMRNSALNLADSTGVVWFAGLPARVTGVDTVIALCKRLSHTTPVFFLGAAEGVAELAASIMQGKNEDLRIAGTCAGSPKDEDSVEIVHQINASGAKILLVAYGAPAQDVWIQRHLTHMPNVKVAMGVGGTFDFIAGKRKRAPVFFQKIGLEWFFRLCNEPSRWRRIFTAVVVFPWLVVFGVRRRN